MSMQCGTKRRKRCDECKQLSHDVKTYPDHARQDVINLCDECFEEIRLEAIDSKLDDILYTYCGDTLSTRMYENMKTELHTWRDK